MGTTLGTSKKIMGTTISPNLAQVAEIVEMVVPIIGRLARPDDMQYWHIVMKRSPSQNGGPSQKMVPKNRLKKWSQKKGRSSMPLMATGAAVQLDFGISTEYCILHGFYHARRVQTLTTKVNQSQLSFRSRKTIQKTRFRVFSKGQLRKRVANRCMPLKK